MSKLKFLVIHCTATCEGVEVTSDSIRQWHLAPSVNKDGTLHYNGKDYPDSASLPKVMIAGVPIRNLTGRGWRQVGYSDMIHLDGHIENLVPYNVDDNVDSWEITNGATGINTVSRHIVYVGGLDRIHTPKDTRTEAQIAALKNICETQVAEHPGLLIAGHNQFASKACPCFNTAEWLRDISIPVKNIYDPFNTIL